jgi:hypothetical protein
MEEKELTPEQMLIETQALLIALKLINLNQKMWFMNNKNLK